jgi:hypothetical protein
MITPFYEGEKNVQKPEVDRGNIMAVFLRPGERWHRQCQQKTALKLSARPRTNTHRAILFMTRNNLALSQFHIYALETAHQFFLPDR